MKWFSRVSYQLLSLACFVFGMFSYGFKNEGNTFQSYSVSAAKQEKSIIFVKDTFNWLTFLIFSKLILIFFQFWQNERSKNVQKKSAGNFFFQAHWKTKHTLQTDLLNALLCCQLIIFISVFFFFFVTFLAKVISR